MKNQFLEAGQIVNTHGIQGEVKIVPWCDSPEFLCQFDVLYVDGKPIKVRSTRIHKGNVLAFLEGVDNVNAAMAMKGKTVFIDRTGVELPDGRHFIADLMGLEVIDAATDEKIGVVAEDISRSASLRGCAPMYSIDIMTLFDLTVGDMMNESILGRAQERDIIRIEAHQIRDYTLNKQKQVDDYPYGGGRGAVMQADPLYQCWKHIVDTYGPGHTIYMSPCGKTFTESDARRLRDDYDHLILVCGHYEGIDQRFIDECVDEEISIGDFVLTGGELAAMVVADAVARLVPGVLADPECFENESHWNGMLEYPQYSRPEEWHGRKVPPILRSGDHKKIAQWRRKQSILRTRQRRPDLYEKLDLSSKEDQKLLRELEEEV